MSCFGIFIDAFGKKYHFPEPSLLLGRATLCPGVRELRSRLDPADLPRTQFQGRSEPRILLLKLAEGTRPVLRRVSQRRRRIHSLSRVIASGIISGRAYTWPN